MRRLNVLVVLLLCAGPGLAQHLGSRQQWQPQTENDPRLQQTVEIEILGRAAVTGLPILSEKTGVPLSVAPEDLATVGERKFTVIAKGLDLKTIMVQLCEALQECHWDIDQSGSEPVYLLHRNSDAEVSARNAREAAIEYAKSERRAQRLSRLGDAQRALRLSPAELDQLEETDLLLARSLRDPVARAGVEAVFSLPADKLREFGENGLVRFTYTELPVSAQQAVRRFLEQELAFAQSPAQLSMPMPDFGMPELDGHPEKFQALYVSDLQAQLDTLAESALGLRDLSIGRGGDILLSVGRKGHFVIPPLYPIRSASQGGHLQWLLLRTGTESAEDALAALVDLRDRGLRVREEEIEAQRGEAWTVPTSEALHRLVQPAGMEEGGMRLVRLQQLIAEQTGLSIISDYFTSDYLYGTDDAFSPRPAWELLYELSQPEPPHRVFEWKAVGSCLVFHQEYWDMLAAREVPESLLTRYREKLAKQGRFTLDDAVSIALEIDRRQGGAPRMRGPTPLPEDLSAAGLDGLLHPRDNWAASLVASLDAGRRAKAESERGLVFAEMDRRQQDQVRRLVAGYLWSSPPDRAEATVLHIVKSEGVEDGRHYVHYDIRIEAGGEPGSEIAAGVRLFDADAPQTSKE